MDDQMLLIQSRLINQFLDSSIDVNKHNNSQTKSTISQFLDSPIDVSKHNNSQTKSTISQFLDPLIDVDEHSNSQTKLTISQTLDPQIESPVQESSVQIEPDDPQVTDQSCSPVAEPANHIDLKALNLNFFQSPFNTIPKTLNYSDLVEPDTQLNANETERNSSKPKKDKLSEILTKLEPKPPQIDVSTASQQVNKPKCKPNYFIYKPIASYPITRIKDLSVATFKNTIGPARRYSSSLIQSSTKDNHVNHLEAQTNQTQANSPTSSQLMYVTDTISGKQMLIDSGSEVSVVPYDPKIDVEEQQTISLYGAGGSLIKTHGYRTVNFIIDDVKFRWKFITAEIDKTIIGIDFMKAARILVDPANNQLICSQKKIECNAVQSKSLRLHVVANDIGKKLLDMYPDLINLDKVHKVKHDVKHRIDTGSHRPVQSKIYKYNINVQKKVEEQIREFIDQGICRFSSSPWASPLAVVIKKDGSIRSCGDFRFINSITRADSYSLPYVFNFNNKMRNSNFFSVVDLYKAFYQIPMDERDVEKTAVQTPIGLVEFLYMPFGLKCAAQSWQRFIDSVLFKYSEFVFCYVDDIIIFSPNLEEHQVHLEKVFNVLNMYGLKINVNKSQLCKNEVSYLGHKVNKEGIHPTAEKIEAILEIPVPTTIKQLKSFLCTIAFYQKFLPNYQKFAVILNRIKVPPKAPKSYPIKLSPEQIKAFQQIKKMLADYVILRHPVEKAPLVLETDASGRGIGAVLNQVVNNELEPLFFFSKAFTLNQMRFDTYRKELEGLYQSVRKMNRLLMGAKVIVYTDNSNLFWNLRKPKETVNQIELRKLLTINQAIDEIFYIPTASNQIADYLSRTVYVNTVIQTTNAYTLQYLGSSVDYGRLMRSQMKDEWCSALQPSQWYKKVLKQVGQVNYQCWVYVNEAGNQLICVPKESIDNVISAYHNLYHPGKFRTLHLIATRFYWPTMRNDVAKYVRFCEKCQKNKATPASKLPIKMFKEPDHRFDIIHMDVLGPMPNVSKGNLYVLSIRDRYTKYNTLIQLKTVTAEETYDKFIDGYVKWFGVPKVITTDHGSNFDCRLIAYFTKKLGIMHRFSTPGHAPSNGFIESPNRPIKNSLRCVSPAIWSDCVPWLQLALNNSTTDSSIYTPSQMVFGCHQTLPVDLLDGPRYTNEDKVAWDDGKIKDFILAMAELTPSPIKHFHQPFKPFVLKPLATSKSVWIKDHPANKLSPLYRGPYEVIERTESYYTLRVGNEMKKYSIERLKPAYKLSEEVERLEPTI